MITKKLILDFEIFTEEVNGIKELIIEETVIEELVPVEEPKEDIPAMKMKDTVNQKEECNFTSFVLNSILDIFYDDFDMSMVNLFDINDLFFSKLNAMKSNFAYLCDVLSNGYSIFNDHFIHMCDINSVQTESFNLGTYDNPKNILIASSLTLEERLKVFAWGYEDMPGIDREIAE